MNTESSSRRRLLLMGILPISLLLIATPLATRLPAQGIKAFEEPQQVAAVSPKFSEEADYETAPRVNPAAEPDVKMLHRRVALDIVERLENEALRENGNTRLTPLDLKRLRNALR